MLELSNIDVNAKDLDGEIPLHGLARMRVQSDEQKKLLRSIFEKMVSLKVKINHENNKGETPLYTAITNERDTIACCLIASKADINVKTM